MDGDDAPKDPAGRRSVWLVAIPIVGILAFTLGPAIYWDVRAARLRSTGTVASARIVAVRDTGDRFNEDPVGEYTLELERDGMPPGPRGTVKDALSPVLQPRYQPGLRVKVWFDPKDPREMAFESE